MKTLCKYYRKYRNCVCPNTYECMEKINDKCASYLYYSMELEKEIKRLKWYLKEIRYDELNSNDIDYGEYETECCSTEYTNIITLVEEALREKPDEECRYKDSNND